MTKSIPTHILYALLKIGKIKYGYKEQDKSIDETNSNLCRPALLANPET